MEWMVVVIAIIVFGGLAYSFYDFMSHMNNKVT